jgi:hypothetical protein
MGRQLPALNRQSRSVGLLDCITMCYIQGVASDLAPVLAGNVPSAPPSTTKVAREGAVRRKTRIGIGIVIQLWQIHQLVDGATRSRA